MKAINSGFWFVLCGMLLAGRLVGQDSVAPPAFAPMTMLPGGILPDSPLAQVIKLVKAGVDVGIIQTFITNSASTFNLDADKIIALKDVGAPNDLAPLMMQHDRLLQAQFAAVIPPPAATPGLAIPASTAQPVPPPVEDSTPANPPPAPAITVNYFYNLLAPYGNWVNLDGYGRCWQPGVATYHPEWQPYADHGHWVYTNLGWYWVSDYSWGWVPFHYGRWLHDARLGWCWCPDSVWGPAWVVWRTSDDYCGWAPLPPGSEYVDGSGFVYDGSVVAPDSDFGLAPQCFIFVTLLDFCDPYPSRHRIAPSRQALVYHQTTAMNHFDRDDRLGFINRGIEPARLTRVTHVPIRPLAIQETPAMVGLYGHGEAVRGSAVVVNRPQFRDNDGNLAVAWNQNPAPVTALPPPAQSPTAGHPPATYESQTGVAPGNDNSHPVAHPVNQVNHLAPPPAGFQSDYHPSFRPEPAHELSPPPAIRNEPAPLVPPAPGVQPAHNSPVPAPTQTKSDKPANSKNGPH